MDALFPKTFSPPSWRPTPNRPHPVIELRELVLTEIFEPPAIKILRRVSFRRGLNIIWADPKTAEARAGGVRTAGHSAGKTTLCRILRWLLGEPHFGPSEKEFSIANKLQKGWAILFVNLDGQPWVVGRRFYDQSEYAAAPGGILESVLANGWPKPAPAKPFLDELTRLTVGSLPKKWFPGRDEDIAWTSLLGWLSRDQEAAMSTLEAWRSYVGGPQERGPTIQERHLLMRLVLELIETKEWDEMENCARLDARRVKLKEQDADVEAKAAQACEPLRRIIPGSGEVLTGPLLIARAQKLVSEKQSQLDELNRRLAQHPSQNARIVYEQALRALERGEAELARSTRKCKRLEKRISERSGNVIELKTRLASQMRKPPPGYCARTREEAEGKCKLFVEVTEDISAATFLADLEQQHDALQEELEEERREFAECEMKMPTLRANEQNLKTRDVELMAEREKLVASAARLAAELRAENDVITPAQLQQDSLDDHTSKVADLSEQISLSRQRQRELRRERWSARLGFADHYRAALVSLLGQDITGGIEFDDDGKIATSAENRASISGAAIEAMKIIALDLAAMFRSVVGAGQHPRLVIHDSPKVADIAPVPYSYIFDLALHAEAAANGNPTFQYIITTTEPPPDSLLNAEQLRLRLDASAKEGRLFTLDF